MRIAIFTDCFVPQINGVVTSLFNLVKGLSDSGHHVFIVAPKYYRRYKEFAYPKVRVLRIPSVPAFFYPDYRLTFPVDLKILAILRKSDIDIINFETPLTVGLTGIIMARMLNKPLIGRFHTFIADPQYLKHGFPMSKEFQRIAWDYCNFFYNKCDLVTSPSEFTRRELIKHGCKRLIEVISNGIDIANFDNSEAQNFRERHDLTGPVMLFVGRIAHEKNIEYLINAMVAVFASFPLARLVMIGSGPQFKETQELVQKLKLSKKILMLGELEHSVLIGSGIFDIADLFVTASETENQPMTILEAQANGIPCVGLSEKGIPDLIKDGVNGLVVPNHDNEAFSRAIIKILASDDLQNLFRVGALREIKKHELSEVIVAWEKTYSKLAAASQ